MGYWFFLGINTLLLNPKQVKYKKARAWNFFHHHSNGIMEMETGPKQETKAIHCSPLADYFPFYSLYDMELIFLFKNMFFVFLFFCFFVFTWT